MSSSRRSRAPDFALKYSRPTSRGTTPVWRAVALQAAPYPLAVRKEFSGRQRRRNGAGSIRYSHPAMHGGHRTVVVVTALPPHGGVMAVRVPGQVVHNHGNGKQNHGSRQYGCEDELVAESVDLHGAQHSDERSRPGWRMQAL